MSAKDLYLKGLGHYGRQEQVEAIRAFEAALKEHPDWADCLQSLGMSLMAEGHLERALTTLTRVTELAPEDPLAFTSLSMCLQRLNRIEDAEKAQAQARLLSWKLELKKNPKAPPPSGSATTAR